MNQDENSPAADRQVTEDAPEECRSEDLPLSAEPLVLSAADWAVVVEALENPPPPSERLIEAFRLHRARVKSF